MKSRFVRIAKTKAASKEAAIALAKVEDLASSFEECEKSFGARIDESKAKRGETPTKLRKGQRETLKSLRADQIALDEELAHQLEALGTAQDVVYALHFGMWPSIEADRKALKHYHPDDLPMGQEMLLRKEQLVAALAEFLAKHPHAA